jgi:hypothetical protein
MKSATIPLLTTAGTFAPRRDFPALRTAPSLDVLDYGLFLPGIWLCCALGISLRLIGPGFVAIPVGTCLLYAILTRTAPPRLLGTYFLFCLAAASLSAYRLFPTSWQVYFSEQAIIRQLVPLAAFFAVAWASKAYFRRRLRHRDIFSQASIFLVLGLGVAPLVMFYQNVLYPGEDAARSFLAFYGSLINNISVAMFFVIGGACLRSGWRRNLSVVAVVSIAAASRFLQFKLVALAMLATLFGVSGRLVLIGLMTTLAGIYSIALNFIPQIELISRDSGVRLALLRDGLTSVLDTYGLGIGYGTESVKRVFHFPGLPVFKFFPAPNQLTHQQTLEMLSIGIHNSFGESLLRTGVLGLVLLASTFAAAFPSRSMPRKVQDHAALMFAIMFIACFVNPALESPIQVIGVGLLYGYLIALRGAARSGAVEAPALRGLRHLMVPKSR